MKAKRPSSRTAPKRELKELSPKSKSGQIRGGKHPAKVTVPDIKVSAG